MIGDGRRRKEAGEFEPTMAVGCAHHGNLNSLVAQTSNTSGPFSFDSGPPFELEAQLAKKINRTPEVIDDDSYVVHPFECHVSNLQGALSSDKRLGVVSTSAVMTSRPQHEAIWGGQRSSLRHGVLAPQVSGNATYRALGQRFCSRVAYQVSQKFQRIPIRF